MTRCNSCFAEYDEALGMCPHCGYTPGELPAEVFCLPPGTVINGRYVIGKMMGVGGFGITYRAWDNTLNTMVAVKEYYPSGLVNRTPGTNDVMLVASKREKEFLYGKTRFLDEARNTARFSTHKNIVNVYDFFEAHNTVYMVMEYLDGETLGHVLKKKNAPLDYEYCVQVAVSLCSALRAIHAVGILHRDIAPDNIMILKNGTVKLFDFGAARFSAEKAENSKVTVVVKPGFAPPEQYDKVNRQDGRTDIYALGATLYYVMTGTRPEESTNRKIEDTLREPAAIIPTIPQNISTAIMRAMAVEQQFRFANVDEFEKALLNAKPVATVEKERKRRKRRRRLSILISVVVVLAAAAAFLILWDSQQMRGDITVWYIQTGDAAVDTAKENGLLSIAASFTSDLDDVTVTVVGIPEASYTAELSRAQSSGKGPNLFESTGLSSEELGKTVALTEELETLGETAYYAQGLLGEQYYPTSVVVPVIYINTTLVSPKSGGTASADIDVSTLDALVEACVTMGMSGVTKPSADGMFSQIYGRSVGEIGPEALSRFVSQETFLYYGDSDDYADIQEALAGQYAVLLPGAAAAAYRYGCTWSVAQAGRHETQVARELAAFLGSGFAQDYLHMRVQGDGLPIAKASLQEILNVYGELAGVSAYLERPIR